MIVVAQQFPKIPNELVHSLCPFRPPAVVFAGHPSLRIGDAAHLLEMWGSNKKNAVILTG